MSPHRFRLERVARAFYDDETTNIELIFGFFFVTLRGAWLTIPSWATVPPQTADLLLGIAPEWVWGAVLLIAGLCQLWAAGTRWSAVRYGASTTICVMAAAVVLAHIWSGEIGSLSVPTGIGIAFVEFWIAWRVHHDKSVMRDILDRRGNPSHVEI